MARVKRAAASAPVLTPAARLVLAQERVSEADADLVAAVGEARRSGWSWEEVARALGVAGQSAWRRFAPRLDL